MHMHWARLIELLHAAEVIKELLLDPDLQGDEPRHARARSSPRASAWSRRRAAPCSITTGSTSNDQITMANLIVSTTNNNEPMNRAVNWVAKNVFTGKPEITEGMLNRVEVAIRAYDPCLSCATHALGKMPLEVAMYDAKGDIIDVKRK